MGKHQKSTEVRGDFPVKAGKKKSYQAPPPPNPENKRARDAGQQQFYSPHQLTQQIVKTVYDKKKNAFIDKLIDDPVPFLFDSTRKRFIFSPRREDDN